MRDQIRALLKAKAKAAQDLSQDLSKAIKDLEESVKLGHVGASLLLAEIYASFCDNELFGLRKTNIEKAKNYLLAVLDRLWSIGFSPEEEFSCLVLYLKDFYNNPKSLPVISKILSTSPLFQNMSAFFFGASFSEGKKISAAFADHQLSYWNRLHSLEKAEEPNDHLEMAFLKNSVDAGNRAKHFVTVYQILEELFDGDFCWASDPADLMNAVLSKFAEFNSSVQSLLLFGLCSKLMSENKNLWDEGYYNDLNNMLLTLLLQNQVTLLPQNQDFASSNTKLVLDYLSHVFPEGLPQDRTDLRCFLMLANERSEIVGDLQAKYKKLMNGQLHDKPLSAAPQGVFGSAAGAHSNNAPGSGTERFCLIL